MKTTIIGIDCATQPKNVGLARGVWHDDGRLPQLEAVAAGAAVASIAETIVAWLPRNGRGLLAIDAPLGWPAPLGDHLHGHEAGEPLAPAANELFRRETDRVTRRETGKLPLDVGADRIARTAHVALRLLQQVRELTGCALPLAWAPEFDEPVAAIEVYPAGTLTVCGLRASGYKGREKTAVRAALLPELRQHLILPEDDALLRANDDVFDAAVCVLAGADFLRGATIAPMDVARARKEGWIWVRRPHAKENAT